jgi:uncharacterized protein (DUF4415 family)
MSDDLIDYSDAAYQADAVWMNRQMSCLKLTTNDASYRCRSAGVLQKNIGTRYQSRMNADLRSYVEAYKTQANQNNAYSDPIRNLNDPLTVRKTVNRDFQLMPFVKGRSTQV